MSDIKLVDQNADFENTYKMNWDICIGNNKNFPLDVYRFPGYCHSLGGRWGDNDYWCCPRGEKPNAGNIMEYDGSVSLFGFSVSPRHYRKCKYNEDSVEFTYSIKITRNGEPFYSFGANDMAWGIAHAQVLITEIEEHPLNFCEIDYDKKIVGRKIWWRGIPAVITTFFKDDCCIMVRPDNGEKYFKVPEYLMDSPDDSKYYDECDGEVKLDVLMDHEIWWFRD